ncbi:MAG: radical SAM family heme chaperone HemW [Ignavibacteria bacterium]|nr:radical SAM family heme chaperone HemW [Ignavibacteria bacterium]
MTGYYVHIPFCEKKCSYCDFYSIESLDLVEAFVNTLIDEIRLRTSSTKPDTIFFGGGTPSLLSPRQLERIIGEIPNFDNAYEVTLECNPGTVSLDKLIAYRSLGVNRLSFGVQSFVESELRFLTRIHTADEASQAMNLARSAGFTNVNVDLMFALPNQTVDTLQYSIDRALALEPDHISAYSLIYEPGTPLYKQLMKGEVSKQNEEVDAGMYAYIIDRLQRAGYCQYEVSNFAKADKQCKHNLVYWHGNDYLAVGPSAHGLVNRTRYWNHRSLATWTQKIRDGQLPQANEEALGRDERLTELLFLTLRADGIPANKISRDFNLDIREILQPDLSYWISEGMIVDSNGVLRLTSNGYAVCDEITVKMLSKLPTPL